MVASVSPLPPGQRVAVIGSGIAGLTSAWLLAKRHEVSVFEADARIGGHTHTFDVEVGGQAYAIDTGFIVFNHWMYPNFIRLLDKLGVASKPTDMCFGVNDEETGLEYSSRYLSGWFAQRGRIFDRAHWRTLLDLLRFSRETRALMPTRDQLSWDYSLGEFLREGRYSRDFAERFIVPMGSAIWSAPLTELEHAFPFRLFIEFFHNHGMLNLLHKPVWRVIQGGSRSYLEPLTRPFATRIRTACPVLRVERLRDEVKLLTHAGWESFDQLVIATHSDQALRLLDFDARDAERAVLGAMRYQQNDVVLHTDERLLPKNRGAWAAWNYSIPKGAFRGATRPRATLTYNMNHLMGLEAPVTFCVTLNGTASIDPKRILGRFDYAHPVYDAASARARLRYSEIGGAKHRTHFAGAYWGYGFHEDGVVSAVRVGEAFGCRL
ncbi:MAG: FAD-dependent oxidoreductase [Polyangiaceae bacterium]|nr:FAD-dependent oxidoreductase [Polyangiaceae bacterium]MCB9605332.1 FAD-dependent oxidoreductase [Polyangiaceae bacterium]